MLVSEKAERRFWAKVALPDSQGCMEWQAFLDKDGYGYFKVDGRMRPAHRVSYQSFVGSLRDGHEIDHLCRNRACVQPDHLEQVTHAENVARGESGKRSRERTHCPRGHEYTEENTRVYRGGRTCRACDRDRMRARRAAKEQ